MNLTHDDAAARAARKIDDTFGCIAYEASTQWRAGPPWEQLSGHDQRMWIAAARAVIAALTKVPAAPPPANITVQIDAPYWTSERTAQFTVERIKEYWEAECKK